MHSKGLPFEEAAHVITTTGWACKRCGKFYGDDSTPASGSREALPSDRCEYMARWCCASSLPCACGGRMTSIYTVCDACRLKAKNDDWNAKTPVEWNGEFPIAVWDDDKYFFDADALYEYVDDLVEDGGNVDDLKLTKCKNHEPREFELAEFLSDDLPEDFELPKGAAADINDDVNKWIKSHVPSLWFGTGERISRASLELHLPELYTRLETDA